MTPRTERMVLCALRVKGVPRISVEEALWTAGETLLDVTDSTLGGRARRPDSDNAASSRRSRSPTSVPRAVTCSSR